MEKQWIVEINKEVERLLDPSQESALWNRCSINRIPDSVTDVNRQAYKPSIISFGPYYHGEERLKPMEEHKRRALIHFLKRSNKPLQSFLDALTPVVEDLRGAYEQLDDKWQDDNTFLEMMIKDGCFILEMLLATVMGNNDYAINDPIFNHGKQYILPILKRDMLKLENQLPILLLEKLVSIQKEEYLTTRHGHTALIGYIIYFFQQSVSTGPAFDSTGPPFGLRRPCVNFQIFDECLHILEVYRKSLILVQFKPPDDFPFRLAGGMFIRSATELHEAGIRIEPNRSRRLTNISFRSGVLKLPPILVDDALETIYLNLIALERFHGGSEVTSYISFMNSIVRSARDVRLLQSCGVIQNALGSDEAVAHLFHSLSKDITLDPDISLGLVLWDVSAYCERPWRQLRAWVVHTYVRNPWAFAGSLLLFAFALIQTIFGVLSYFRSPL